MVNVNKLFFGFADVEKWLNTMGEKSLLLLSVSDGKYTFEQTDKPIKYFIDHTEDSPFTEKNRAYIDSKTAEGYKLACICGRNIFFYSEAEMPDYSQRYKNMITNVRLVFLAAISAFMFSMGIMLYEMKQIKVLENAVFEGITPRSVALIMVVPAAISLGLSIIYLIEWISLSRSKKEVTVLEQATLDQTEQSSEGVQSDSDI